MGKWNSEETCVGCGKYIGPDYYRCDECIEDFFGDEQRSRALTEWEAKKLEFHRSEKKWNEDISKRSIAVDKNGKKVAVYRDREGRITGKVPNQPTHLRKAPDPWQPPTQITKERIDK